MKKKISKQMVAFVVAAMLAVSGLSGCGAVKETEIPTETAVLEETTEEVKTEEVEESTEQEETTEEQSEVEEETEKVDWAAIWPETTQQTSVEHLKDANICIDEYRYDPDSDEDSDIWIGYGFQKLFINDEGRNTFPKLAEAIDKYNDGVEASKETFLSEKAEYLKNYNGDDSAAYFKREIKLTRVDDSVFSFIETRNQFKYNGWTQEYYTSAGINIDTDTGEEIKLSDVIADEEKLIGLIYEKLDEWDPTLRERGDNVDDIVIKYINGEYEDELCWVMMPYGITVFFNPGVLIAEAVVPLEITVTYLDNPELFTDKYTADKGNWAIPVSEAYIDVNGDGKSDHVYAESAAGEDSYEETKTGIYVNDKAYTFDNPYSHIKEFNIIKNGDAYYMYVITTQESDIIHTFIYKLSGSEVTFIGEEDGVISSGARDYDNDFDFYRTGCLYNPEKFYLSYTIYMLDVFWGAKTAKIGGDGVASMLDDYYAVSEKVSPEFTAKTDITVKEVDEAGSVGEEKTIPAETKFKIFRCDYESFVDCVLEDGSLIRIEMEKSDPDDIWPDLINGKSMYEVLDTGEAW